MNSIENSEDADGEGVAPTTVVVPATENVNNRECAVGCEPQRQEGEQTWPPTASSVTREQSNTTTYSSALLHLMKSSLGTGILAMPNAFKNGGLIFGLFGTAAIGFLATHCIYLLVMCSQTLARRTRRPRLGYADTAAAAFSIGPRPFRAWGPFVREFINAGMFCTYYFGGSVYIVLIASTFKEVAETHTPPEWHFTLRVWVLALIVPLVPLGIIRTFRLLVPFSAMAMTFIIIGLGCTIMWVLIGVSPFTGKAPVPLPDIQSRPWMAPVTHLPLFFATVLFAMEGIGTVLPIENSMSQPQKFLTARPCGVLNFAMTLIISMYSIIGFLGYLRFGNSTAGSITLNLPNDLFAEIVKVMVALSILFSYGLQFCVPSEIVWSHLEPWLRQRKQKANNATEQTSNVATTSTFAGSSTNANPRTSETISEERLLEKLRSEEPMTGAYYTMRILMILGTVFIATLVPDLAPFISLIGAVFYSILGLLCPAVIHLAVYWHQSSEADDDDSEEDDFNCDGDYYSIEDDDDHGVTTERPRRRVNGESTSKSKGMSRWIVFKDIIIILMALIALVSGTYISIRNIMAVGAHNSTISSVITLSLLPGINFVMSSSN
ncbi:Amino acid transporter, transmembrane domain [Cinara cedri]|uniref:Amino acid transporter, transmembrane domain n=1 Tax=Cinara cedri TaxID=506608 RepID=A0A5E4N316_9HEMI|nr:Amino acid transporter, transmembrane domain [Cinara cedri]